MGAVGLPWAGQRRTRQLGHHPLIAVFDPDETTTAQRGMYVVYLFAEDRSAVYLTLNQGATETVKRVGRPRGRTLLAEQAGAIRDAISPELREQYEPSIDLQSRAALAIDYQAGVILAKRYTIVALPGNETLVDDLQQMIHVYQNALDLRRLLPAVTPEIFVATPAPPSAVLPPCVLPRPDNRWSCRVV